MQTLNIKGRFKLDIIRADGTKEEGSWIDNIITTVGKAEIANLIGNVTSPVYFTYLAVGSSATAVAAGDTALTAEISTNGLARVAATRTRVTTTTVNDTVQWGTTWTASGSATVNEIGVFNAASVGILLCHALTGALTLAAADLLVATYQVKIT